MDPMTDSSQHDLQTFLFDHVEGEEDLRVLAWLRHLEGGAVTTASDVANATGIPDPTVSEVLGRLVAKGLLGMASSAPVGFTYAPPPNAEFSETLDEVLERYVANPLEILRIMSENSIDRVTLAALRTLAEAPRPRGPKQH
jgi:hypothetical protein